jgi:hypothetical protein
LTLNDRRRAATPWTVRVVKLLSRSALVDRNGTAFALPYLEALLGEQIFPVLVQVIEKVSGAADETSDGA